MRILRSEIYFPIIIGIHFILWAVDLTMHGGPFILAEGESSAQRVIGEIMSSWVITVFGFNLLMTTRARWVERIFGGLDKMYVIHRRAGMIAVVLLLLHFAIVPKLPEFTIGKPMGFAAMVLIFFGVVLSAARLFKRRIPYHRWLGMHRLMGPFYVLGVAHAFNVPTLISELPLVRTYVFGMAIMGVAAWLYRVFFHRLAHPGLEYEVASVEHHGGSVVALELEPTATALDYVPGQFAFFGFRGLGSREGHPFTIASHPTDSRLRIAIKAAGDFTAAIQDRVTVGTSVLVEGPYGHLTQPAKGGQRQIWVAGGIGITPFLAMARELTDTPRDVTLYWTVPTDEEAHFDAELQALAERIPGLTYNLWLSNISGRLTLDAMAEAQDASDLEIFICGPAAMRDVLTSGLRKRGVPQRCIHSEEFLFR